MQKLIREMLEINRKQRELLQKMSKKIGRHRMTQRVWIAIVFIASIVCFILGRTL